MLLPASVAGNIIYLGNIKVLFTLRQQTHVTQRVYVELLIPKQMIPQPEQKIKALNTERQRCLKALVSYRLKCVRLCRRLTVAQVSAGTLLHKKAIERIEAGWHNFTFRTIEPLINFYQLSYSEVFAPSASPPTKSEWRYLKRMQRQLNAYHKSKHRLPPQTGVQLEFKF